MKPFKALTILSYAVLLYQIVLIFYGLFTFSIIGHVYNGLFLISFVSINYYILMTIFKEQFLKEIRFRKKIFSDLDLNNKIVNEEFISRTLKTYFMSRMAVLVVSIIFVFLALYFSINQIARNFEILFLHLFGILGISSIAVIVISTMTLILIILNRKKTKSQKESTEYKYYVVFHATVGLNLLFSVFILQMLTNIQF